MKLKDFDSKNLDINCYISIYKGQHNDGGELISKVYGYSKENFIKYEDCEVVYITTNETGNGIILEIE